MMAFTEFINTENWSLSQPRPAWGSVWLVQPNEEHCFLKGEGVQHCGGEHTQPSDGITFTSAYCNCYIVLHCDFSPLLYCSAKSKSCVTWTTHQWICCKTLYPPLVEYLKSLARELWQKVPRFAFVHFLETTEGLIGVDPRNLNMWLNCEINNSITVQLIILTDEENYPVYFIPSYLPKTST